MLYLQMKAGKPNLTKLLFQPTHKDRQVQLIKSGILLASVASLLAIGACGQYKGAQSAAQPSPDPAAATVNGTPISQRTVDMMAKQGANSRRPDTPETRKAIIDQLTLQMVVAQEAIKKGLDKSPEVTDQIDAVKQSVLANAYVQDYIKNNPITDDMLKAEYERIKATVTGTRIQGAPHPGREGSRS